GPPPLSGTTRGNPSFAASAGAISSTARGPPRRGGPAPGTHGGSTMATTTPPLADLAARAKSIRKNIITSTTTAGSGHPTSSLSAVEIAVALYFGGVIRYDPKNPHWPQRDRFLLSKGHAAPRLSPAPAAAGYSRGPDPPPLRTLDAPLEAPPTRRRLAGVEASPGSPGQGLSIGTAPAPPARLDKLDYRVYVLL